MSEPRGFGDTDHDALKPDDVLAQAIGRWGEESPARDLWPGVAARLQTARVTRRGQIAFTLPQLAMAASLLIAVASGLTWLAARPGVPVGARQAVVLAESEPAGLVQGDVQNADFADAQFDAAVTDLERILRDERDRLDPRTVLVIERNLKTIDEAIREARMALNGDPANTYLNSHLADARRRKIELLRHAATLASAGGD